jgi:molybdopterin converting factor small subunit
MQIEVHYATQVKRAAGVRSETVTVPDGCTVQALVRQVAEQHGEGLRKLLLKTSGDVQPGLLLFLGEAQVAAGEDPPLTDGATLTIMSPISGG